MFVFLTKLRFPAPYGPASAITSNGFLRDCNCLHDEVGQQSDVSSLFYNYIRHHINTYIPIINKGVKSENVRFFFGGKKNCCILFQSQTPWIYKTQEFYISAFDFWFEIVFTLKYITHLGVLRKKIIFVIQSCISDIYFSF